VNASSGAGPADQYARFQRNRAHPALAEFGSHYEFGLDDFQVRA
jgi:ATP-dependent RNA helicase HelY